MYSYLVAEYFSHRRNKTVVIFSGPHAPHECIQIFEGTIRQYPKSKYEIYQSIYGTRDKARGEWIAKKLGAGTPIDDAMERTHTVVPGE